MKFSIGFVAPKKIVMELRGTKQPTKEELLVAQQFAKEFVTGGSLVSVDFDTELKTATVRKLP